MGIFLLAAIGPLAEADYLSYEKVIQMVKQGKVKSLTLGRMRSITGTYMENETEQDFNSLYASEACEDPLLLELLEHHGVKIEQSDVESKPDLEPALVIPSCLILIIPIVILAYVIKIHSGIKKLQVYYETQPAENYEIQ